MKSVNQVVIDLYQYSKGLNLIIDSRRDNSLFDAGESAVENNEAQYQLAEGCFYDFELNDTNFKLADIGGNIVQPLRRKENLGILAPNIFVGTLSIPLIKAATSEVVGSVKLEVQSLKTDYRNDYRDMLEYITEQCTDLLLQVDSPVTQSFDINHVNNSQSLYQRFSFIRSVIGTNEFTAAIHKIVSSPVTRWTEISEIRDIRNIGRLTGNTLKEIATGTNRRNVPRHHALYRLGIETLPEKISVISKTDSEDTPENRFIKHALETFLKFCVDINHKAIEFRHERLMNESELLIRDLNGYLHHSIFRNVGNPHTLKLNSPVLQRKEGYREVLRTWLMFDLAANLIWKGGDDVYDAGKKDIAVLYEYWVFFKLLKLMQELFEVEQGEVANLIKRTDGGLNLELRQGKFTAIKGLSQKRGRKLQFKFCYNRSFAGKQEYPKPGSWTTTLRPDYTLSIWPMGVTETEAEHQELIVHVHFDAKYKVRDLFELLDTEDQSIIDEDKLNNRKGIYKNGDLLKMHAYKDAIRRTGGAYVLYPGVKPEKEKGFHEIIPGLGAFPLRPSRSDSGIGEVKSFILEVIEHFILRSSQREKFAFRTWDIHKSIPEISDVLSDPLPEAFNENRGLIPDETSVLVGFYDTEKKYRWISESGLYNFRIGTDKGSLVLNSESVEARYLLLHTYGDDCSGKLMKIKSRGMKVFSKDDLLRIGCPTVNHDFYLVIEVEKVLDTEFKGVNWDFKKLGNYKSGRMSGIPFTTTLAELMKHKV